MSSVLPMNVDQLHAARQRALKSLRADWKGSLKDLAEVGGVSPSYLTRMLKEPGADDAKAIGDEVALKFESGLDLEPGALVWPREMRPGGAVEPSGTFGGPSAPTMSSYTPVQVLELLHREFSKVAGPQRELLTAAACTVLTSGPDQRIGAAIEALSPPVQLAALADEELHELRSWKTAITSMAEDETAAFRKLLGVYLAKVELAIREKAHVSAGRARDKPTEVR